MKTSASTLPHYETESRSSPRLNVSDSGAVVLQVIINIQVVVYQNNALSIQSGQPGAKSETRKPTFKPVPNKSLKPLPNEL
jgi:hypothetical protein